jgi:hypothetical protein
MMFVRLDEPTLIMFDRPDDPPSCIEAIDALATGQYQFQFFDHTGRFYQALPTRVRTPFLWGLFSLSVDSYKLAPTERLDLNAALKLAESAVGIEPNPLFKDIADVRRHLRDKASERATPEAEKT